MAGKNNDAYPSAGGHIRRVDADEMRILLRGNMKKPVGWFIARMEDGSWTGADTHFGAIPKRLSGTFKEVIEWLIPPTGIVRNVTRERQTDWKAAVSSIVPVRIAGAQIREWTEPVRVFEIRDGGDPGEEAPAVSGEHEAQKKPAAAWRSGIAMRDARILALFREGKSWEEIGGEVNLDPVYVRQRIAKMRRKDPSIPDALKEKKRRKDERILELLASGMSHKDCAQEVGFTAHSFRNRLSDMRSRGIEVPERACREAREDRARQDDRKFPLRGNSRSSPAANLPRILELLRSGMSREDCARELGVTADYLRKRIYVMRRRGIEVPDARDAEEERRLSARVSGMRERGFSCAEIARQVGVSMSTIYRILRATGGEEAENEMQGG